MGRCRVETRGFWVDKGVADEEDRPRERQDLGNEVREGARDGAHRPGSTSVGLQGAGTWS